MIKKCHLEQIADMSGDFKNYLDELLIKSESERAKSAFLRLDQRSHKRDKYKMSVHAGSDSE